VCSICVRKPPSSAAVGAAGTSCTARSSHVLTCSGARAGELLPVFGHRSPARSRTAFATRLSRSSCWPLTASAPVRQIPSVKQTQSTNKVWIQTQRVKGTNPSFSYERAYVPSSPHTSSHMCMCMCMHMHMSHVHAHVRASPSDCACGWLGASGTQAACLTMEDNVLSCLTMSFIRRHDRTW